MTVGRVVFLPPNGDNIIQPSQGIHATVIQPQGTVQYVHYKSQWPGSPNNPSQQTGPLQKLLKAETKTLGAIQIIIGLIHISLGAVPTHLLRPNYQPLAVRGYPIGSGLFFIFSGSLSVAVEKHLYPNLMKCNVGINIASAIVAIISIIHCFYELHFNQHTYYEINQKFIEDHSNAGAFSQWSLGVGLCVLLILFSLLEFFITVFTTYSGYQAARCNDETVQLQADFPDKDVMDHNVTRNLAMAPEMKMVNGRIVIIAPNGVNTIQEGEMIPSTIMHYMQNGSQHYGGSSGQPQKNSCIRALEKFIKLEAKALGAIQIMIGLINFGLGIISLIFGINANPFAYKSAVLYPVYSGLSFIISGSVSVSAEKHWNSSLKNTSVGMNILSAIMASSGIVAYICELVLNLSIFRIYKVFSTNMVGVAFSVVFLLFSSVEFCITVMMAHFGCRANCCTDDTAIVYVPCTVTGENIAPAEDNLASQSAV